MRDRRLAVVLSVFVLLCALPLCLAQKFSGTLTGTVSDPTGAVVPGADLKVTNQSTGTVRTAVTNGEGGFTVPELTPGPYTITVTKSGFKQTTQKDVGVHVS